MTLRIGVIGMGFMGTTHARAFRDAEAAGLPCRLAAVADQSPERLANLDAESGNLATASDRGLDLTGVTMHAGAEALLADDTLDAVSICTPTGTHVDLAIRALKQGLHVLVEKPVALAASEVERLADAAAAHPALICMPAMCMRFWPEWAWLHAAIIDGRFGPVRTATFQRLASPPTWSDFYRHEEQTGGALFDLHVHDADFIHWCFGPPDGIVSTGTIHHLGVLYRYDHGPAHVMAEGGWTHHAGFAFRMRYIVVFEQATADFDLGRDPTLLLIRDGEAEAVPVPPLNGWQAEVRAFVEAIRDRRPAPVTVRDAAAVIAMLEQERASGLRQG
ncbi:MAG: Gfo/Idh/MocA family oxidoreductase [Phycisphaerales bacterium]|nr:Gfo/Idh/MocA family oxidoreductase [Phycisphaerales bacterium]